LKGLVKVPCFESTANTVCNQERVMMSRLWYTVCPKVQTNDFSFFSGGVLCDAAALTCGGAAIGVSGAIVREGHTFVLTHGVTSTNVAGNLGFKLSYLQLPCGSSIGYSTTDL
jgi:uncharacterized protein (UPF0303 family)